MFIFAFNCSLANFIKGNVSNSYTNQLLYALEYKISKLNQYLHNECPRRFQESSITGIVGKRGVEEEQRLSIRYKLAQDLLIHLEDKYVECKKIMAKRLTSSTSSSTSTTTTGR